MGSFRCTSTNQGRRFWLGLIVIQLFFILAACSQKDEDSYVRINTPMGEMRVLLYNSTPQHRDNFLKLVKEGFYDELLFHRVIGEFMAQGGDPNSKNAPKDVQLGGGGPGYTIPAEIGAPHLKGALAAARTPDQVNPNRASSGSQFYIIQGRKITAAELDAIAQQQGVKYNEAQRKLYQEIGGYPELDGAYTVFGEVVEGLDVIDKIIAVQTDALDRPIQNITMSIETE